MSILGNLRGKSAEQDAEKYLRRRGLKILDRNKRYKCGEIDIIAANSDTHIFVEVKYRSNDSHGLSAEMISSEQQARLGRAAKLWLQEKDPNFEFSCRFDVIAISDAKHGKGRKDIQWVKNAFNPELW